MPQHIVVKEYNPLWVKEFEKEKEVIAKILGANAAEIYHIGSTAVPGLCAKPVIDIMPVVYSLAAADDAADKFRAAPAEKGIWFYISIPKRRGFIPERYVSYHT